MFISKRVGELTTSSSSTLAQVLEKIDQNQHRIIFVTDPDGRLEGCITDGDIRRFFLKTGTIASSAGIDGLINRSAVHAFVSDDRQKIETLFRDGVDLIPLVDKIGHIVAVAIRGKEGFEIDGTPIDAHSPAYVIAEIGNNHNGDIDLAKRLVDLAKEAGADCAKFQMRDMEQVYKDGAEVADSADLGAQYTLDLLQRNQLSSAELLEVFDHCKKIGITPLCTPWDENSLRILENYGMEGYKVASADLTNHPFIEALAKTRKPLILSTGMSTEGEIIETASFLNKTGAEYAFLHCNSTYPAPFKDVNLKYMERLAEISGRLVGYSGHERGYSVPIAAVAMGARIIEKHFTVDRAMEGSDHKVSLLPDEFAAMVREIRSVEAAMGTNQTRKLSQGEMINRESLAKSLVINRVLKAGERITREMIEIRSPGQGLQPHYLDRLVGLTALRDFSAGDLFFPSDIDGQIVAARNYTFSRPFGIPVRYHDFESLSAQSNLDFVEFHLSYNDMKLDPADYLGGPREIGLAVHSPELFAGDHILDLATSDDAYRKQSIRLLNEVCDTTRALKRFFPATERPIIVVNAGGFHETGFVPQDRKAGMYARVEEALTHIDQTGVEIIIQTMPPFPWHFGGQRYHNLFVDPAEIEGFCNRTGYRICFDTSHSAMACKYYGWDFNTFTETVAGFVAHMHIVDSDGVDGEGVEIGRGEINFHQFAEIIARTTPDAPFIPEIWQGHKNNGSGFWHAFEFLESVGL